MAQDPVRLPNINNNSSNMPSNQSGTENSFGQQKLPQLQLQDDRNANNQTNEGKKRIIRWNLWWDKSNSELKIPTYSKPSKSVNPKINSLQNVTHKPSKHKNASNRRILNNFILVNFVYHEM